MQRKDTENEKKLTNFHRKMKTWDKLRYFYRKIEAWNGSANYNMKFSRNSKTSNKNAKKRHKRSNGIKKVPQNNGKWNQNVNYIKKF